MAIELHENSIRDKFAHYMEDPLVVRGLAEMVSDRFLLAFFLMSVSEGEAMGEAGVAAIREEEIAKLIQDIERQEREEAVLQQNRQRLKDRGSYSRLNLYLTTTLGYEIMVGLHYEAVIEAVAASGLSPELKDPIVRQLRRILDEEDTHLEIAAQHNLLLEADRAGLQPRAVELLEALEALTTDDYEWAVDLSMKEIVKMIGRYAEGPAFREEIEGTTPVGGA